MSGQTEPDVITVPYRLTRRDKVIRAVGIALVLVCLLIPCGAITLATQGEIVFALGSAPGQELRVWLVMEAFERGLGISTPNVVSSTDTLVCVQTDVHYALWVGRAEATVFCDCYVRADSGSVWSLTSTSAELCR
jgi:hypothetical protein